MAKKTPKPGRTLLVFLVCVAVLYGLAAIGGTWKPRLGLDLQGGTRITLVAESTGSGSVTSDKLREAAGIIESRVNGSGVSEAEVSTQGNTNIIVEIPGKNRKDLVDSVKRTAQLRFRLVAGQPQPGVLKKQPQKKPTTSPTTNPKTPKTTVTPDATSTPKPRVAPNSLVAPRATPKPDPTTPPAADGAAVDDPMKWINNPGTAWTQKFAKFACPTKASQAAPVKDNPKQPLIACDDDGNKYLLSASMIEGTQLGSASYGTPQNGVGYVVNLGLKGDAKKTLATISTEMVKTGGRFAIVLDGKVLSAPGFNQAILDGNAQIEGSFSEDEASSLANSLKYGALPLKFKNPPTVETIGPSLAGDQLSAGVFAGIVGLLLVMLYCLVYYRGLGGVVIASLIVAGLVTYATVLILSKTAGFALSLPGIAGLIVAVGITADSFIVYFERIRDEMRTGKSMRVAVESGWSRARNTCLAADAVSLLAAVVLYIFAIGVVKGFAFTLGISTVIDVVVFFWFTKPMVSLTAKYRFFNTGSRFSGLSKSSLGVDGDPRVVGGRA